LNKLTSFQSQKANIINLVSKRIFNFFTEWLVTSNCCQQRWFHKCCQITSWLPSKNWCFRRGIGK